MKSTLINLQKMRIINPEFGDFKLQVYPFNHNEPLILPKGFEIWQKQINNILNIIPYQSSAPIHYLTIDSKFMTTDECQRREGVHIDGNFCIDPKFQWKTWGGTGWSGISIDDGKIIRAFASPYDYQIPFGTYVSDYKGGIICASSYKGCECWTGTIPDLVGDEGSYPEEALSHTTSQHLDANVLYFMSSNAPHRTLIIPKGVRRTLIRITLNHNYDNTCFILNQENFINAANNRG